MYLIDKFAAAALVAILIRTLKQLECDEVLVIGQMIQKNKKQVHCANNVDGFPICFIIVATVSFYTSIGGPNGVGKTRFSVFS